MTGVNRIAKDTPWFGQAGGAPALDRRRTAMDYREARGCITPFYPGNSAGNSSSAATSMYDTSGLELTTVRLVLAFVPSIGLTHSDDLAREYLTVHETRTKTPFFGTP